jgi:heterodisulfide reductase subunit A-like polyferredoxin
MVFSNHFARVDTEICNGCETCLDRCQMGTIKMNEDERAEIDMDRCIGCGLCVITCPTGSLSLVAKSDDQRRIPPPDYRGQMELIQQLRLPASPY